MEELLKKAFLVTTSIFTVTLFVSSNAMARSHIHMVGSSTVYPFATTIAEKFGLSGDFKTPVVEATGTGGGVKLFCLGIGEKFPDFVNASRGIEESEIKKCNENNVKQVIEIKIGYDGIVLAESSHIAKQFIITKKQLFLALANKIPLNGELVKNPYHKWSDIDKSLPNKEIVIYGPPTSSGTRDAFVELVMEKACSDISEFKKKYTNSKDLKRMCRIIRTDGKFIEAGENDNLIVQKLKSNPDALGIFGFGFLRQNGSIIRGIKIDGVMPNFDNIISGKYTVSRPLFIYLKKEHINLIPGMKEFVYEIINEDAIGEEGYLVEKGLIPMRKDELKKMRDTVLRSL